MPTPSKLYTGIFFSISFSPFALKFSGREISLIKDKFCLKKENKSFIVFIFVKFSIKKVIKLSVNIFSFLTKFGLISEIFDEIWFFISEISNDLLFISVLRLIKWYNISA